jgi:hypothetical protein
MAVETGPEPLPAAVQPRHHRSDRHARHLGDLRVPEPFGVRQENSDHLMAGQPA